MVKIGIWVAWMWVVLAIDIDNRASTGFWFRVWNGDGKQVFGNFGDTTGIGDIEPGDYQVSILADINANTFDATFEGPSGIIQQQNDVPL